MAATIGILLAVSLLALLGLWWAIERETSNPTVLDREEAERRAIERGGRGKTANRTTEESRRQSDDTDDERVGRDD